MIFVEAISLRIERAVQELEGHVGNAGDFARIVEGGSVPQSRHHLFVLPGAMSGGAPDIAAGLYRQTVTETVKLVLFTRVFGDALGAKALDEATPLVRKIITALSGWSAPAPANQPTWPLSFARGEFVGSVKDALLFEFDFAVNYQMRIIPS